MSGQKARSPRSGVVVRLSDPSFRVRVLVYAAVLVLDLAGGIAFGWHFAVGGAAGAVTAFAWLWVNAR